MICPKVYIDIGISVVVALGPIFLVLFFVSVVVVAPHAPHDTADNLEDQAGQE